MIDGYKYYFDKSGKALTGIKKIGDYTYCFDKSGRCIHGVATADDKAYVFGVDGALRCDMSKVAFENLKARCPEPTFISTEPIQCTSKGDCMGFQTTAFYANLDANFFRVFGLPSTEASVINNMGADDKYLTYMLYTYMNKYIISSWRYQAYKDEALGFLGSIVSTGGSDATATGNYAGLSINNLSLVRPLHQMSAASEINSILRKNKDIDTTNSVFETSSWLCHADWLNLMEYGDDVRLNGYYDRPGVQGQLWNIGRCQRKTLETIDEYLHYDIDELTESESYGILRCVLDDGKWDYDKHYFGRYDLLDARDNIFAILNMGEGNTWCRLTLVYNVPTCESRVYVKKSGRDERSFRYIADAEEYIWGDEHIF